MKYFDWNEDKNVELRAEREVCFENVVIAIIEGRILDIFTHPNQQKYPNQKVLVIEIDNYAYLVPFTEDEQKIFLKTIIPSRKATRFYIINKNSL